MAQSKSFRMGEGALIVVLAALFLMCVFIVANARDAVMSFHMSVGAVAALLGIFAIFRRYTKRANG